MNGLARIREGLARGTPVLSVGVLTADLLALGGAVECLERTGVTLVHFDVMDGNYVPMLTFGAPVVKAVRTPLLKDVHLMVEEPLAKLADFVAAGADMITIHPDSTRHPHRVLQALGSMTNANDPARGIVRGVAVNPGTPLAIMEPLLSVTDMVVVLAVNPGWGGQGFIETTGERLAEARRMIRASGREILLAVDGGVTRANVAAIAALGPDIIVTGSAVFDGKDAEANAREMLRSVAGARTS
jgi:ribulose-phosphate 3-epimerase